MYYETDEIDGRAEEKGSMGARVSVNPSLPKITDTENRPAIGVTLKWPIYLLTRVHNH